MHCLFTGFDPFNMAKSNPSQQAVERLGDKLTLADGSEARVHRAVLPTAGDTAWQALEKAVAAIPAAEPFTLVMCGLAEHREKVSLEWFALNVRDYRIADNRGDQWKHETIVPGAADAFHAKAELTALMLKLEEKGVHACISYHAGTFVCNETYFRALEKWGGDERCAGIVFIHLPSLENYGKWFWPADDAIAMAGAGFMAPEHWEKVREQALEQYVMVLEEAAKFMCGKRSAATV
jgi:pyroglutamyl-peptidase